MVPLVLLYVGYSTGADVVPFVLLYVGYSTGADVVPFVLLNVGYNTGAVVVPFVLFTIGIWVGNGVGLLDTDGYIVGPALRWYHVVGRGVGTGE